MFCFLFGRGLPWGCFLYGNLFFGNFEVSFLFSIRLGAPLGLFLILQSLGFLVLVFRFLFGRGLPRAVSYTPIFRFFGFSVLFSLRSGAPLGLFLIRQTLGFLVLVFCFLFGLGLP